MGRWFKGLEAGQPPPGAQIIQLAVMLNKLPEEIENMDAYWFNRLVIWQQAEAQSNKMSQRNGPM